LRSHHLQKAAQANGPIEGDLQKKAGGKAGGEAIFGRIEIEALDIAVNAEIVAQKTARSKPAFKSKEKAL
jgi:hypothetical protein